MGGPRSALPATAILPDVRRDLHCLRYVPFCVDLSDRQTLVAEHHLRRLKAVRPAQLSSRGVTKLMRVPPMFTTPLRQLFALRGIDP